MTKILHVFDHSLPLHSGYAFRSAAILREQRRQGMETVHLTTPRYHQGTADHEDVDGLRFHRSPPAARGCPVPGAGLAGELSATERALRVLSERERPDVIHAHSPILTAIPALRVGRRLNLPVVYEIRAFWEDAAVDLGRSRANGMRYHLTKAAETWVCRRADAVMPICTGLRDDLVARGIDAGKIALAPNAVDIERFPMIDRPDQALAAKLGLADCEVVGFCGSFYAYEGLDDLLAAAAILVRRRPRLRILMVGGGPMDGALREQAQRLGIQDRVLFTGRVPNDEVVRYYSLMTMVAFPRKAIRLTETVTPLKPLEAMAQGIVCVASSVGGHRELIEHGATGLLVAPGAPDALAAEIERALGDDGLRARLRRQGRAYVESSRGWRHTVASHRSVYDSVLASNRRSV